MADDLRYCGTGANFNDGGNVAWSNPTNIQGDTTSTAATATGFTANGQTSQRLRASNFGFELPTGAVVNGIIVSVEQQSANNNRNGWHTVELLKSGSESGDNKSDSSAINGKTIKSFGANNDLWGNSLTYSDVNNSGFGVSLKIVRNSNSTTTSIFRVEITVYYTTAQNVNLPQSSEADLSQGISTSKSKSISQSVEVNAVQPIAKVKYITLAQTIETDTANSISIPQASGIELIQVNEINTAQDVGKSKYKSISQAVENNSVQSLTSNKLKSIENSSTGETSGIITAVKFIPLNTAIENSLSQSILVIKKKSIAPVEEINTALTVTQQGINLLNASGELNESLQIKVKKIIKLNIAIEYNFCVELEKILKRHSISFAEENNESSIFSLIGNIKYIQLNPAFENDDVRKIYYRNFNPSKISYKKLDYELNIKHARIEIINTTITVEEKK